MNKFWLEQTKTAEWTRRSRKFLKTNCTGVGINIICGREAHAFWGSNFCQVSGTHKRALVSEWGSRGRCKCRRFDADKFWSWTDDTGNPEKKISLCFGIFAAAGKVFGIWVFVCFSNSWALLQLSPRSIFDQNQKLQGKACCPPKLPHWTKGPCQWIPSQNLPSH